MPRRGTDGEEKELGTRSKQVAPQSVSARVTFLPLAVQHVDQMLSWPSAGLLVVTSSIVHPLIHYSELPRAGQ